MAKEEIDPTIHKNTGLTRVIKALLYSCDGIASTFKHEAAFRQELLIAVVLVPLSFLMRVPLAEHLILVVSILLVLVVELLNSAIEAVVDDISLRNRPLAKRAKDMGSAAVLLMIVSCAACWISVVAVHWGTWFS